MKKLTNNGSRRLGVPGRPALILSPSESALIDDDQLRIMQQNRTVSRWLESGVLSLTKPGADDKYIEQPARKPSRAKRNPVKRHQRKDERKVQELPEGLTGDGIEYNHLGGGWWQVFVNGFKVTDRNVRKAEAETIATEYVE